VRTNVIDEDALLGRLARLLERYLVDSLVRLADADHGRLDEVVEHELQVRQQGRGVRAAGGVRVLPVVGDGHDQDALGSQPQDALYSGRSTATAIAINNSHSRARVRSI